MTNRRRGSTVCRCGLNAGIDERGLASDALAELLNALRRCCAVASIGGQREWCGTTVCGAVDTRRVQETGITEHWRARRLWRSRSRSSYQHRTHRGHVSERSAADPLGTLADFCSSPKGVKVRTLPSCFRRDQRLSIAGTWQRNEFRHHGGSSRKSGTKHVIP